MIHYVEPIYRPPSEARSLILQATIGCSHNKCAFCVSYQSKKFFVCPEKDLFAQIDWAGKNYPFTQKVFLADGDAMALSTNRLGGILDKLFSSIKSLKRVSAYGRPGNFRTKSIEDLACLKKKGLSMIYVGIESGNDELLGMINKEVTSREMEKLLVKPVKAGMDVSATVILGLGGPRLSKEHAKDTARLVDAISPKYISALTLMLESRIPSFEECVNDPSFRMLNSREILVECKELISGIHSDNIIFRSNHASNYMALAGNLQQDKEALLLKLSAAINNPDSASIRPEAFRAL